MQAIAAGVVLITVIFIFRGFYRQHPENASTLGAPSLLTATPGTASEAVAPPVPAEPVPAPRPIYKTTATELFLAYQANEVAADRKIGDAVIEVTGTIVAIDKNFTDNPVVRFDTGVEYRHADVELNKENSTAAAALSVGETVTVRCDKMQRIMDVPYGTDCDLVGH
jgi:hypothetical protein